MNDLQTLTKIAIRLLQENAHFGNRDQVPNMIAFLRYKGKCVYCEHEFFTTPQAYFGIVSVDHLLPRRTYPRLETHPLNLVPCCRYCNNRKWDWDPNTEGSPLIYEETIHGATLSEEQHAILLSRAQRYVKQRRESRAREFIDVLRLWHEAMDELY